MLEIARNSAHLATFFILLVSTNLAARDSWPISRLTAESDLVVVGQVIETERIGQSPVMSCCYDRYHTSIRIVSVLKSVSTEFSAKTLSLVHDVKLPSQAWREGVEGLGNPPRSIDWKSDSSVFTGDKPSGERMFLLFLKKTGGSYEVVSGHQLAALAVCALDGVFDLEPKNEFLNER